MLVRRTSPMPMFSSILNNMLNTENANEISKNNDEARGISPAVNIREDEQMFSVEMAIPGFSKEEFVINVKDDVLTISADKEHTNINEDTRYTRREYAYKAFTRSFAMPENVVDVDKINARYENGELIVHIPKREEAKPKPARTISIS